MLMHYKFKIKTALFIAAVVVNFSLTPVVLAQTTDANGQKKILSRLSYDEVLRATLEKSPEAQAIELSSAERQADAVEVATLQNPTAQIDLSRQQRPETSNGFDVEIEQPLQISHLTGERASWANKINENDLLRKKAAVLNLTLKTRDLYNQYWILHERLKLYQKMIVESDKIVAVVKRSGKAGQTAASDVALFMGDAERLKSELKLLESQQEQLRQDLEQSTGFTINQVIPEPMHLKAIPMNIVNLLGYANTSANKRRLLESDMATAAERYDVASLDGNTPTIAPRLLYSNADSGEEEAYGVGVAVTIPLWDRNSGERIKARAAMENARRQLDVVNSVTQEKSIINYHVRAIKLAERATAISDNVLPNYREAYAQAQKRFNVGQASAFELWQVRERLYKSEEDRLTAMIEAMSARADLERELGGLIENID